MRLQKQISVLLISAMTCVITSATYAQTAGVPSGNASRTPVLVELFTSEGCSTCPPADDLLEDLVKHQPIPGVLIVGLGEHVDYWNQLGWTDRFSSGTYSQRQRMYAKNMKASDVYTPQMLINGSTQVSGSDRPAVVHAIVTAAKKSVGTMTLTRTDQKNGSVQVTVALLGVAKGEPTGLFAAVTDDDDTTMVTGGENGGHSLRYGDTVRSMRSYGPIAEGQTKLLDIQLPPDFAKKKMHVVVFAQSAGQGNIVAAATLAL